MLNEEPWQDRSVIRIERLSRRFGEFEAVRGIDLEVFRGEVFALLGPNGAGKTTTILMLMGLLEPSSGAAFIEGMDCFANRESVMRHVGYLPEEPIFYDYLRGREVASFVGGMHGLSSEEVRLRTERLAERFGLVDAMDEYAVNYSRGMRKKLALICALLHDPSVLILDEPTDGLDPYATRTVHNVVRQFAKEGRSVFFSTHLLDQAEKLCDRVGVLYKGKLAGVGCLEELRANLCEEGSLEEIFFALTQERETEAAGGGEG